MSSPVWLETALNGPWTRARQPLIPIAVEEIAAEGIACAKAGAAIVHFHAYDPDTGLQRDTYELYASITHHSRQPPWTPCSPPYPATVPPTH